MAFRLYVGNYPFSFTKEDVQNLFRDFDGVKVDKICKKESKSFAFLTCNDIDQLVSVIKNMNRTSVSGRKLIVRASDKSLQEYVDLILQNEDASEPEESSPMKIMRNKCRSQHKKSDSEKSNMYDKVGPNGKYFEKYSPKSEDSFGASKHCEKSSHKSEDNFGASKHFGKSSPKSEDNFNSSKHCEKSSPKSEDNFGASKLFEKSSPKSKDDFGATSKQFEKRSPKSEDNFIFFQKKSTPSSRSMHNNVTDCETSLKDPYFPPKIGDKLNDQTNLRSNNESHKNNAYFSSSSPNSYQSGSDKNEHEYLETSSHHYYKSPQKSYHQTTWQNDTDPPGNTTPESQRYCQQKSKRNDHHQFNNFSGYSFDNTSDVDSQASRYDNVEHFYDQRGTSFPAWVSVTNFHFGTNARALYNLFSDYKPLRVKMICNVPQREKMLAEAHVCFPNREIADDVILNFDNTMFEGRIILVNDVEDLTIMNELLNISHS